MRVQPAHRTNWGIPAAALFAVLIAGCSTFNPFHSGDGGRGYVAPREMGEGDCSVQVINRSARPLEVYFHLGLHNPPRVLAGWPRLGLLEPGDQSVIFAECEELRITLHAFSPAPVNDARETRDIRQSIALVEGRRDTVRLRTTR